MTAAGLKASGLGLARNEQGTRFPHAEELAALQDLRERIQDTLAAGVWEDGWDIHDLDEPSPVDLAYLVEQGLMSPEFAEGPFEGRGFAVYGGGVASLEIGRVDHIRLLGFRTGDELPQLWSLLSSLDDKLESTLSYAFDPYWGYLTGLPNRAGTGLRAYATLHVPSLVITGRLASVALEIVAAGYGMSPLWGGAGGIIQVFNLGRQGKSEAETIQETENISRGIIEKERSVRKMFMRENPIQMKDHIGRALGVAQHAWNMTFQEAVNLISAAEVGLELGLVEVPGLKDDTPFDLMRRLQPAHVVMDYMKGRPVDLQAPEIDQVRAQVLRDAFSGSCVLS